MMNDFYKNQEIMKSLLTGDLALESLEIAENEYLLEKSKYSEIPVVHKPSAYNIVNVLGVRCLKYCRDDSGWMGTWRKGDIYFNKEMKEYLYVPDCWDFEDVRLDEVVYRPF